LEESILKDLLDANALIWIFFENLVDEGLGFRGNLGWILVCDIDDSLHGFLATDVVERRLATNHLVSKNPHTPDVNTVVVALSTNDLGRHVVKRAAVCGSAIFAYG
jgi:hypothetical protein